MGKAAGLLIFFIGFMAASPEVCQGRPSIFNKTRPFHETCRASMKCLENLFRQTDFSLKKNAVSCCHDYTSLQNFTPLKTNMTSWKIIISNRKYIFIHGGFSIAMVGFFLGRYIIFHCFCGEEDPKTFIFY